MKNPARRKWGITQAGAAMDQEPEPPKQPGIRPPDLPQIPKPDLESRPATQPVSAIPVRIRESQAQEDPVPEAGDLAPFNSRFAAAAIDGVLSIGLALSCFLILPDFAERLGWLLSAAYWIVRDSLAFTGGRSVGKIAMKLQVTTSDDKPLVGNWRVALLRNAPLLIPFFALIEIYVLLKRDDTPASGRRLGDEWAKTKVVVAPEPDEDEAEAG
jgi:uncharacterized RDD family membrane protein YckC